MGGLVFLLLLVGSGVALYAFNFANVKDLLHHDASASASVGPSVAVMPFENLTVDVAQGRLADDLTEGVIAALSRFKELRVLARNMTASYRGRRDSSVDVGRALRIEYLIEGSVRGADGQTRVSIQLIDTTSGAEIWARTYDQATVAPDQGPFQSQVVSLASASVGTWTGAIAAHELKKSQGKAAAALTAYECTALGYAAINDRVTGDHIRRARDCLKSLLEHEPRNAAAWASLSYILLLQRYFGLGLDSPESLDLDKRAFLADLAVAAARRAVELAPDEPYARFAAASAFHGICKRDLLRVETERMLALNPSDPALMGPLGNQLGFEGLWNIGRPIAEKAIALAGPSAPSWWWWVIAKDYWVRGDYLNAFDTFQKSYVEQFWLSHLQMAYALPFLGRLDEAKAHVATLLRLKPGFTIRAADAYYRMWCFEPSYREKMRGALRSAGLPE
jgi:TolB-like protein